MPDELWTVALAGVVAGLGVAMPLGAVAALLLREGLLHGFRAAAPAALGVGAVDTAYCALAMVAGAALAPALQGHRGVFLMVSGTIVALVGLAQLILGARTAPADPDPAGAAGGPGGEGPAARSSAATFLRFVGLTALNPLTLVYFAALAAAVTAGGGSWHAPVVFVVAVGGASLTWQLLLAASGSFLGRTVGAGLRRAVGLLASLVVVTLGVSIAVGGVAQL